jgi:hypothetical protein
LDAESTVVHREENSQHRGDSDALDRGEDDELTNDISMVVDQPNECTISDIAGNTSILTTPSAPL